MFFTKAVGFPLRNKTPSVFDDLKLDQTYLQREVNHQLIIQRSTTAWNLWEAISFYQTKFGYEWVRTFYPEQDT